SKSPFLIYYRVNASRLRIHHDDRAGMMTQGRDRSLAYFQILTHGVVLGDVRLDFVAQCFFDGPLSGNCRLARGFSATASFFHFAPVLGSKPAHLCGTLTFAELVTGPLFKFGKIC